MFAAKDLLRNALPENTRGINERDLPIKMINKKLKTGQYGRIEITAKSDENFGRRLQLYF